VATLGNFACGSPSEARTLLVIEAYSAAYRTRRITETVLSPAKAIERLRVEAAPMNCVPQFRAASDDVRQTGLYGNSVLGSDGLAERAIERELATRKQGFAAAERAC